MKRIIFTILSALTVFSCTDLTGIQEQLNDHENRIAKLELLCSQMNTNIESIKTIVDAMEKGDYITDVKTFQLEGKEAGYIISLAKGKDITIYHGKAGDNGTSGIAPKIGVKKDTDGAYYWTINSDWLLDDAGNKIKAQGQDATGKPGQDGKDGLTPELKIEGGYWYVRYGTGEWKQLGKATGEDGAAGEKGDSLFQSVSQTDTEVTFELTNGEVIVIPKKQNSRINYTTSDGNVINLNSSLTFARFGASLISNVYENGQGVMTFDGDVRFLGKDAFINCINLKSITLPESVKTFEARAFYGCSSLETINLPKDLETLGKEAFANCSSLVSITIPSTVKVVGDKDIASYTFDDRGVFEECTALKTVILNNGVEVIGPKAFARCSSLTNVIFPKSLKRICYAAFNGCSNLTEIQLPEDFLRFTSEVHTQSPSLPPTGAFQGCTALKKVVLNEKLEKLGRFTFYGCTSLSSVFIKSTTPMEFYKAFDENAAGRKIYVPSGSVDAYKAAPNWSEYAADIVGYDFSAQK